MTSTIVPLDAIKYQVGAMQQSAPILQSECIPMAVGYQSNYDQNGNKIYEPAEMEQRTRQFLMQLSITGIWGQYSWISYFNEWLTRGLLPPVCIDDEPFHGKTPTIDNLRSTEDINTFWRFYRLEIDFSSSVMPIASFGTWGLPTQKQCTDPIYRSQHSVVPYLSILPKNGFIHLNCYIQPGNYQWISQVINRAYTMLVECDRADLNFIVWLQPLFLGVNIDPDLPGDEAASLLVDDDEWTSMLNAVNNSDQSSFAQVKGIACWMSWKDNAAWQSRLQFYLDSLATHCAD